MASFSWLRWLRPSSRHKAQPVRKARREALSLEALETRLTPTTFTWRGGFNANWSNPGNWVNGIAPTGNPAEQDNLVFPAVANLNSVNDLPLFNGQAPT